MHPFTQNINELSIDELEQKISELNNKIQMAYGLSSASLVIPQMFMLLEDYTYAYNIKIDELLSKKVEAIEEQKVEEHKKVDIDDADFPTFGLD